MNDLVDLFIVIFAGLIHATLQLGISALLLLYHASLGSNIKRKTKELTMNFILGFSLFTGLAVASICFFTLVIFGGVIPPAGVMILVMALTVMSFFAWFVYYQKSTGTELWIPRSFANFVSSRAQKTDDNVESFSLGMLIACAEIPFSIMLILAAGNSIINMPQGMQIISVLVYVIFAAAPMWIAQILINRGKTVVEVQKWRVKNKSFFKIISGVGFVTLAVFLLAFKIMGNY